MKSEDQAVAVLVGGIKMFIEIYGSLKKKKKKNGTVPGSLTHFRVRLYLDKG